MARTGRCGRSIDAIRWFETSGALALMGWMSMWAAIQPPPAQAQTYEILRRFKGETHGYGPEAGVILDSDGTIYGTTGAGGVTAGACIPSGCGVVFKLDASGAATVLHSFTGAPDGANPYAGLAGDGRGNFYGTAQFGGAAQDSGVVFKVDTAGTETVLHSFGETAGDGACPTAGVIRDSAGNLYGTTVYGGTSGQGVVFKLDSAGVETVLHTFTGYPADGANPYAGLDRDSAGNLYGTTAFGGAAHAGVVYKLDPNGTETVLYNFTGGSDGGYPDAALIQDSAGNLYGTTVYGGASYSGGTSGYGVVFELDKSGMETVLYSFTGGLDGANPIAGLVRDSAGNLYGTTWRGGSSGYGVVFKLDTAGTETVLHTFTGGTGGGATGAGLIRDAAGDLFGTTPALGGKANKGSVFQLHL